VTLNRNSGEKCKHCLKGIYAVNYDGDLACVVCSRPKVANTGEVGPKDSGFYREIGGSVEFTQLKRWSVKLAVEIGGKTKRRKKSQLDPVKTELFSLEYISTKKQSKVRVAPMDPDRPKKGLTNIWTPQYILIMLEPHSFDFLWTDHKVDDLEYWIDNSFTAQIGEGKYRLTYLREYLENEIAYLKNPEVKHPPVTKERKQRAYDSTHHFPHMRKKQTWTKVFDDKAKK